MPRRILLPIAAAVLLLLFGGRQSPHASDLGRGSDPGLDALLAEDCDDAGAQAAQPERFVEGGVLADNWPPNAIGGLIPPLRSVADLFPTFDGIALDTENDRVIMSDENRHSILAYERTAGGSSNEVTEPVQWVFGPKTRLGYIAGVEGDPKRKEFYTVNNDSGDIMTVFSYED